MCRNTKYIFKFWIFNFEREFPRPKLINSSLIIPVEFLFLFIFKKLVESPLLRPCEVFSIQISTSRRHKGRILKSFLRPQNKYTLRSRINRLGCVLTVSQSSFFIYFDHDYLNFLPIFRCTHYYVYNIYTITGIILFFFKHQLI